MIACRKCDQSKYNKGISELCFYCSASEVEHIVV
jgi:hypothetical protein